MISCPKRNNTQIKNWIAFKYDNISSTNKLTDIFPDSSPNDVTKNTFETTHLCVEQTNTCTMIHCTNFEDMIGMVTHSDDDKQHHQYIT